MCERKTEIIFIEVGVVYICWSMLVVVKKWPPNSTVKGRFHEPTKLADEKEKASQLVPTD